MLRRRLAALVRARLKAYPAVALLGARQVGKTTLAKALPGRYFDLERPADRLQLDIVWGQIVAQKRLVILDEVQTAPEIFPRLRSEIDRTRDRNGRFLLLGSIAPALMREVAESLAGRLALCELGTLTLPEVGVKEADALWLYGGYPNGGILEPSAFPAWQINYLDVLSHRDLPLWGLPASPRITTLLFRMLAAAHGTVWNASEFGRSLGLSYHTVNTYLGYLEHAYLVRALPPYHANIGKRLTKSPKIYWRDSGLLHALLRVETLDDLFAQPWIGRSWEGWVIEQILSHLTSAGASFGSYFFRTHEGHEIDLVLELGRELWAIEIKLASAPTRDDFARVDRAAELINATKVCMISRTRTFISDERRISANPWSFIRRVLQPRITSRPEPRRSRSPRRR